MIDAYKGHEKDDNQVVRCAVCHTVHRFGSRGKTGNRITSEGEEETYCAECGCDVCAVATQSQYAEFLKNEEFGFCVALERMEQGKKVKRKDWAGYIEKDKGAFEFWEYGYTDYYWKANAEDAYAKDWQEVPE